VSLACARREHANAHPQGATIVGLRATLDLLEDRRSARRFPDACPPAGQFARERTIARQRERALTETKRLPRFDATPRERPRERGAQSRLRLLVARTPRAVEPRLKRGELARRPREAGGGPRFGAPRRSAPGPSGRAGL